jgi:dipeptidyl aminopeptidase/acylaminoacyl peptidase
LTAEALQRRLVPRGVDVSHDGRIAFSAAKVHASPPQRAPESRIWLTGRRGGARQLTDGPTVDSSPRWAPDGDTLAFLSDRDHPGRMSIYNLDVETGASWLLAEIDDGSVEDLRWSSDGCALLALVEDHRSHGHDPDPRVSPASESWRRLYRVDVATGRTVAASPEHLNVWEFDWDGADRVVAVLTDDPSESSWYAASLGAFGLASPSARTLHRPRWQLACPRIAPDGARVAFLEGLCSDRGSLVGTVKVLDLDLDQGSDRDGATQPAPELDVAALAWRDEARLWYAGLRGMRSTCGSIPLEGGVSLHDGRCATATPRVRRIASAGSGDPRVSELWSGEVALTGAPRVCAGPDGRWLVSVAQTHGQPPEVAVLEVEDPRPGWRPVCRLNAALSAHDLGRVERLTWHAPDGLPIEGLLVTPRDRRAGEPLALVVVVHGGPTGRWSYQFPSGFPHAHLLAGSGYAVLLPNPRGSCGRGQDFARAVIGDLGGAELDDILAGVDACVRTGVIDEGRVGIMGASHGGFIAAWAVTQTDRFAASVAIACVSDYLSLHFTSDIGRLDEILFDGAGFHAYVERSPVAHAATCSTPTLILHGELDRSCPPSQAQELYQALVAAGVETELVMYPREGHGWLEPEHQLDLWHRVRAWFDRHL